MGVGERNPYHNLGDDLIVGTVLTHNNVVNESKCDRALHFWDYYDIHSCQSNCDPNNKNCTNDRG